MQRRRPGQLSTASVPGFHECKEASLCCRPFSDERVGRGSQDLDLDNAADFLPVGRWEIDDPIALSPALLMESGSRGILAMDCGFVNWRQLTECQ